MTPEIAMKQEVDFILNTVGKLFCDIDYFAEYASKVAIENYKDSIRSNRVYSYDAREEGPIFVQFQNICAIPWKWQFLPFLSIHYMIMKNGRKQKNRGRIILILVNGSNT